MAGISAAGAVAVALVGRHREQSVKKELKPNGGATLRDAIDRIDRRTEQTDRRFATVDERINNLDRGLSNAPEHIIELTEGARVVLLGLEALRKEMDVVKRDIITREVRERLPEITDTALARDLGESSPPDPV